jgi:hypothetical protein
MSRALRFITLTALLLGAIALGACGGDADREAKNTYVRELNAAQQEFAANASKVSENGNADSVGQYRLTVERFEDTIGKFATKLRAIEVPGAVEAEHKQLIAALTSFGTDFKKAAEVLKNPSTRAVSDAKNALSTATQRANARIEAAAAAIDSKLEDT